ncbi:MAG: low molecular weight phosphotyrosine protein phosphatase [Myxococcales bacterium FL481]|nr:MAG: low molecular weight phosphotyrosine protein phosphatase [Myxococcales bacterium FL481]
MSDRVAVRVCFVCLGNICRSPTAEGVFLKLVREAGLESSFVVDSAGTGSWHVGAPADARARATAKRRGIELVSRARQFKPDDFDRFDVVVAMDHTNAADLRAMARAPSEAAKVRLLRDFGAPGDHGQAVPDPYYGGDDGFEVVFDLCEVACSGLLDAMRPDLAADPDNRADSGGLPASDPPPSRG